MKRKRFTKEHIVCVLKESEVSAAMKEVCRLHGIRSAMFSS